MLNSVQLDSFDIHYWYLQICSIVVELGSTAANDASCYTVEFVW